MGDLKMNCWNSTRGSHLKNKSDYFNSFWQLYNWAFKLLTRPIMKYYVGLIKQIKPLMHDIYMHGRA